ARRAPVTPPQRVKCPCVRVATDADEGSSTMRSMSPLAVIEKRRLPDGISHARRMSFSAENRAVPDGLHAPPVNSAASAIRVTLALLATFQTSRKMPLGGLSVSNTSSLPSFAVHNNVEEALWSDAVSRSPGKLYSRLVPPC